MLGEIEFDPWQCVAELIDNSFDDFTEIIRSGDPWAGGFKVIVTLPSPAVRSSEAQVVITDTGRGMSYETLERAVSAGWSSNDRFDKLGLFGMGFNVATARLGRRTRVLTTRPGDPEWIGVEIDLDRIGDDFEADDITEPKADPNEHGTKIEISRLHGERADWLRRNAPGLRNTLGRTYAWLLDNRPFELWVQGQRVKPRRHCRWGEDRYVTYGSGARAERISAYIKIDQKYEDAEACQDCGNWQVPGLGKCGQCQSERLTPRERRIHGWLGVQRHLDKREFGIDFLRNGRKILQWDKRLFEWQDPNDPTGAVDTEYPIELANQGGRLIGEIHLDHVPVTYQKNAFEYSSGSWRGAVEYLRGAGPLQPEKAKRAGYQENDSPLGQLYKAYRRNAAGARCLIPGDGKGPIHEETRRWAQRFHAGDPEYQSDQRWWDAVINHEEQNKRSKLESAQQGTSTVPNEAAVLEALGVGTASDNPSPADSDDPPTAAAQPNKAEEGTKERKETFQERIDRYRLDSVTVPDLSRDFGLPKLGFLSVETRRMSATRVQDADDQPTPVLLVQEQGGKATAFVDPAHAVFNKLGAEAADLLLMEVAAALKVKAASGLSHSELVAELRAECLPDTALDSDRIAAEARELLVVVREKMAASVDEDPERAFQFLSPDELTATENEMIALGLVTHTEKLGSTSEFIQHAPSLFLVKLLEAWPEAFMDAKVFNGAYSTVSSPSARRISLATTVGYLNDVATVASFTTKNPLRLQRTRLSIRLLADELAEGA
ncbi:ATP-binding protein [Streptomyces sp. CC210A]|uniref:ATP-binding protein n=1 Tax=Streptomyces sp. CC210A TaxID=2898184 RepID=UPI001F2F9CC0|nr:ATP-binding protein [Streptomyces sp. CC210A]